MIRMLVYLFSKVGYFHGIGSHLKGRGGGGGEGTAAYPLKDVCVCVCVCVEVCPNICI